MPTSREKSLLISYLAMRRLIGILGISLPVVVVIGGLAQSEPVLLHSISGYYYSNMRDFFVGILSSVALFLISYKGYEPIDDTVAKLSGTFAIGMVLFPTGMHSGAVVKVGIFQIPDNISEYLHLAFSALFFLALSFNAIFLFTRKHPGVMGKEKRRRNIIYRTCGIIMLLCIVLMSAYTLFFRETSIAKSFPILIFEFVALLAFGISWLIKGNTLLKDKNLHIE